MGHFSVGLRYTVFGEMYLQTQGKLKVIQGASLSEIKASNKYM